MEINVENLYERIKGDINADVLKNSCLFMVMPTKSDFKKEFGVERTHIESLAKEFKVDIQIVELNSCVQKLSTYLNGLSNDPDVNGIIIGNSWKEGFDESEKLTSSISWYKDIDGSNGLNETLLVGGCNCITPIYARACMSVLDGSMILMDVLLIGSRLSNKTRVVQYLIEKAGGSTTIVHEQTSKATIYRRMHDSDEIFIFKNILDKQISFSDVSDKGWCLENMIDMSGEGIIDIESFDKTNIYVSNNLNILSELLMFDNLAKAITIQKEVYPK